MNRLNNPFFIKYLIAIPILVQVCAVFADIRVTDDAGNTVSLTAEANRIVSLAPNLTELLFSAGAGDRIIATVSHSDHPVSAMSIPRIGDANNIDIEQVTSLAPDLVVIWISGNSPAVYNKLDSLGFVVYRAEPDTLEGIAQTIERLGTLAGTGPHSVQVSHEFREKIERLRNRYATRKQVRIFYQFWDRPVYTVNGSHLISKVIELCGGINIFADLPVLTPQVSTEAVIKSNPGVIIVSGVDKNRPDWLDHWHDWPEITAVSNGLLFSIPPDIIQRHTTRIYEGALRMCEMIQRARETG